MKFEVDIAQSSALLVLRNGNKKIAFAVVNALNETIKEVQKAQQAAVAEAFTVRMPAFIKREAGVIKGSGGGSGFASVGQKRFSARIQIGQKKRLLLSGFESGRQRDVAMLESGHQPIGKGAAVPIQGRAARPSKFSGVPANFTIKGLRLIGKPTANKDGRFVTNPKTGRKERRQKSTRTSADVTFKKHGNQIKGENRTFILKKSKRMPYGGILQRIGPKKDDIRAIYEFKRGQTLRKMLAYTENAMRVAVAEFPIRMAKQVNQAFKFAAARLAG